MQLVQISSYQITLTSYTVTEAQLVEVVQETLCGGFALSLTRTLTLTLTETLILTRTLTLSLLLTLTRRACASGLRGLPEGQAQHR